MPRNMARYNWAYPDWPECGACTIGWHEECDRWNYPLNCACHDKHCRERWYIVGVL